MIVLVPHCNTFDMALIIVVNVLLRLCGGVLLAYNNFYVLLYQLMYLAIIRIF